MGLNADATGAGTPTVTPIDGGAAEAMGGAPENDGKVGDVPTATAANGSVPPPVSGAEVDSERLGEEEKAQKENVTTTREATGAGADTTEPVADAGTTVAENTATQIDAAAAPASDAQTATGAPDGMETGEHHQQPQPQPQPQLLGDGIAAEQMKSHGAPAMDANAAAVQQLAASLVQQPSAQDLVTQAQMAQMVTQLQFMYGMIPGLQQLYGHGGAYAAGTGSQAAAAAAAAAATQGIFQGGVGTPFNGLANMQMGAAGLDLHAQAQAQAQAEIAAAASMPPQNEEGVEDKVDAKVGVEPMMQPRELSEQQQELEHPTSADGAVAAAGSPSNGDALEGGSNKGKIQQDTGGADIVMDDAELVKEGQEKVEVMEEALEQAEDGGGPGLS